MKKLLLLLFTTLLLSCTKKIDSKILKGTWRLSIGNGDYELSFNKDSIYIENGYGLPYSGTYSLKNDSIFMKIGNTFSKAKIKYNKIDSLLTLDDTKYWKRYDSLERTTTKKFNFINIKSKNKIHLNKFNSINYLLKVIITS